MFWTEEKLQARIAELDQFRYRHLIPIHEFASVPDEKGEIGTYPPEQREGKTLKIGDYWRGRDQYLWLFANIKIPSEWIGKEIVGIFDFGKTGEGNNSGFESLLFVNNSPYQGVDSNHKEVFLPDEFAGKTLELAFRLWSGLEGGGEPAIQEHKIKYAAIGCLDEDTDDLYWTSKAIKLSPYNCVKREIEKEPCCFPFGRINSGQTNTKHKEECNHGSISYYPK
ncbi:MAG: hypothetical protein C6P37_07590 [Caldibacillus debilis]|uniref:Uncharacterized protein n=1 Tax=Caldibacillus debilis TaxID=301148 RepID=A0A3E0K461_9BACI|nr:hypothetical protein [Caldibacillus debilis]REJ28507.1 MAG: hypothetical protein C6P37_07590 [Caldibacillus debilis]